MDACETNEETATAEVKTTPPEAEKPTGGGKMWGIACGANCITAWCVQNGLRLTVKTDRSKEDSEIWHLTATNGSSLRMMATIFGGRWTANVYTRMVRNAMVARANRIRRCHENQKSKKAAATAKEA